MKILLNKQNSLLSYTYKNKFKTIAGAYVFNQNQIKFLINHYASSFSTKPDAFKNNKKINRLNNNKSNKPLPSVCRNYSDIILKLQKNEYNSTNPYLLTDYNNNNNISIKMLMNSIYIVAIISLLPLLFTSQPILVKSLLYICFLSSVSLILSNHNILFVSKIEVISLQEIVLYSIHNKPYRFKIENLMKESLIDYTTISENYYIFIFNNKMFLLPKKCEVFNQAMLDRIILGNKLV